jgi:hypothetical protein
MHSNREVDKLNWIFDNYLKLYKIEEPIHRLILDCVQDNER